MAVNYAIWVVLCLQALGEGSALLLVAGLVEQGEHVALVGLHARLVVRVDTEHVAAHAAGFKMPRIT